MTVIISPTTYRPAPRQRLAPIIVVLPGWLQAAECVNRRADHREGFLPTVSAKPCAPLTAFIVESSVRLSGTRSRSHSAPPAYRRLRLRARRCQPVFGARPGTLWLRRSPTASHLRRHLRPRAGASRNTPDREALRHCIAGCE